MAQKYEYSEYEVLKLKKNEELVFFIKRTHWKEFILENDEELILNAGLKISFREISEGIDKYNSKTWNISWHNGCLGGGENDRVIYGKDCTFEVDKRYRRNGLGSYILDSLTHWAKDNFSEATVHISKPSSYDEKFKKNEFEGFYSPRNLNQGVKVSEVKDFLKESQESGKVEVISPMDCWVELSQKNFDLKNCNDRLLKSNQFKQDLIDQYIREKAQNKRWALLLIAIPFAIGWFLSA